MNNKTFIYILIDPRNDQVRYVGKTDNIKIRYNKHIYTSKKIKKPNKNNSWIKSLLNNNYLPIIEIVDEVLITDWSFWEMHYISLYKSWGFKLNNHNDGGRQHVINYKHTNKTKEEISEKLKIYYSVLQNNPMYGKKHKDETKKKMSIKKQNLYIGKNNPRARSIIQYDKNLNFIKEWDCAKDFTDTTGLSRGNISSAIKHNMLTDTYNEILSNKINELKQYINKNNCDDTFIAINKLKKEFMQYKTVGGFIFKFKTNE